MEEPTGKPNWFVRILIIIFLIILITLVFSNFIYSQPRYQINSGTIITLGVITIIILSESFHNLSLGQFITLSRQVKRVDAENTTLRRENNELQNRLVQVTQLIANFKQSQISSNTPINITTLDINETLKRSIGVISTKESELGKAQEDIEQSLEGAEIVQSEDRWSLNMRNRVFSKIEDESLNKYCIENRIPKLDLQKEVRFSDAFEKIDPIMERVIFFDGYYRTESKEYFFELNTSFRLSASSFYYDRLYVMLSKILYYRQAKNISAELIYILANIPEDISEKNLAPSKYVQKYFNNFIEAFQPAINNGLLRLEIIAFTEEEINKIIKDLEKEIDK
jgi:hypothetical protein